MLATGGAITGGLGPGDDFPEDTPIVARMDSNVPYL